MGTPASLTEAWQWASAARARVLDDVNAVARHGHVHHTLPAHLPGSAAPKVTGDLTSAFDRLIEPRGSSDPTEVRATHVAARRHIRQNVPHGWLPLTENGAVALRTIPEGPVVQYMIVGRHTGLRHP